MYRKVAAALVAAVLLAVAGCGGGGDDELTRAQLASKVEKACTQASEKVLRDLRSERGGGTSSLLNAVLAMQADIEQRIASFEPPDAVSDDFEAFKEGMTARAEVVRRILQESDSGAVPQSTQASLDAVSRKIKSSAAALGARSCT